MDATPKSPGTSSHSGEPGTTDFFIHSSSNRTSGGFLSFQQSSEGGVALDHFPKDLGDNGRFSVPLARGQQGGGGKTDFGSGGLLAGVGGLGVPAQTLSSFSGSGDGGIAQQRQPSMFGSENLASSPSGGPLSIGDLQLSTNNPGASTSSSQHHGASASFSGGASSGLNGDYGLLGLLRLIAMSDSDRKALALGSDPTLLGLGWNNNIRSDQSQSIDQLYHVFATTETSSRSDGAVDGVEGEPNYQLPSCYYITPPVLKTGHLSKFQLETLFYIFYALSRDVLQAYSAQELYDRDWRYHGELKLWFFSQQQQKDQFVYFDVNTWERRLFSSNGNMNQNLTKGFLPEEEVRVKFSPTSS